MPEYEMYLLIARDEINTLLQYSGMLKKEGDTVVANEIVSEIMGDEFNHALIALLSAAKEMGVKIAEDDISTDPNKIEVE